MKASANFSFCVYMRKEFQKISLMLNFVIAVMAHQPHFGQLDSILDQTGHRVLHNVIMYFLHGPLTRIVTLHMPSLDIYVASIPYFYTCVHVASRKAKNYIFWTQHEIQQILIDSKYIKARCILMLMTKFIASFWVLTQ